MASTEEPTAAAFALSHESTSAMELSVVDGREGLEAGCAALPLDPGRSAMERAGETGCAALPAGLLSLKKKPRFIKRAGWRTYQP